MFTISYDGINIVVNTDRSHTPFLPVTRANVCSATAQALNLLKQGLSTRVALVTDIAGRTILEEVNRIVDVLDSEYEVSSRESDDPDLMVIYITERY